MALKCDCEKWEKNINIIISPFIIPHSGVKYEGDVFEYCPWCSKKLKQDELSIELTKNGV